VESLFDHLEAGVSLDDFLDDFPTVTKEQAIAVLETALKDDNFYKSFGAFASKKPAEEIIADIKLSKEFRKKEIKF